MSSTVSSTPKSFREFDTLTLARMAYCAIDTPSSVLAERVLRCGLREALAEVARNAGVSEELATSHQVRDFARAALEL